MPNSDKTYSVHGYDSFSHEGYPIKSGLTKDEAIALANERSGTMKLVYVFDKNMNQVHKAGSY